jgi:hypothetical protein
MKAQKPTLLPFSLRIALKREFEEILFASNAGATNGQRQKVFSQSNQLFP